jgi:hypothetical protein
VSDTRTEMVDAIRESVFTLARLRSARPLDVLANVTQTYRENLDLSLGTGMESYWRVMIEVAEGPVKVALV